jgi:hypothetical protein
MKLTILFVVVVGAILVWWLRSVKPDYIRLLPSKFRRDFVILGRLRVMTPAVRRC